ncbi:fatty acyl-CoA reductase wat-like [Eurosta solidaginis]|uniref:fatty acyl-CoA reductase wat-like n=1 Tax=Eurosta solidaginis TaxID=178769 RepID=UPI0035306251
MAMSASNMHVDETPSDLQNFYRNKTVFVTGGTGFMGIVFIEKLLRATEVKRVYMLVRPKREKSADERLAILFQNTLFDKLRATGVNPTDRIHPILGDCNQENIGISPQNRKLLINEVNVVIHLAATVRFNETLYKATCINVRATLDLIKLAKEMKHLEAFVHVSSAFANCVVHSIDEKYYNNKLSVSAKKMCELCDTLGFETTNKLEEALCKEYRNTYTYTKALAEEAVLSEGRSLPISVFRPAIVIQTYNEPLPGWIGNLHGPSAILYASGRGVLRVMFMKAYQRAHLVPADYCANLMLAIGWETAKRSKQECLKMAPPIYNYSNHDDNPLNWKQYISTIEDYGYEVALTKMIWYPFLITVDKKWLYLLLTVFYHTIPGYILDFLLVLKGKKRRMIELYSKIEKQSSALDYFIMNNFEFTMENTMALWNSLTARDKELFNFDLRSIYWKEYIQYTLKGMRLYLCGETPDSLPSAKKKYKKFVILHYTLTRLLFVGLFLLLWTLLKTFFFLIN